MIVKVNKQSKNELMYFLIVSLWSQITTINKYWRSIHKFLNMETAYTQPFGDNKNKIVYRMEQNNLLLGYSHFVDTLLSKTKQYN